MLVNVIMFKENSRILEFLLKLINSSDTVKHFDRVINKVISQFKLTKEKELNEPYFIWHNLYTSIDFYSVKTLCVCSPITTIVNQWLNFSSE